MFMGKFFPYRRWPVNLSTMKIEDLTRPYFSDEELKWTVLELNYKG